MIITKEQQEALVNKYIKEKHNQDECIGFIDGLNAILELISNIEKRQNTNTDMAILPMQCYGKFIKPLVWDNEPKERHVYKCVSVSYVPLPVQGNWKSHIAICNEDDYGFKATLWLMNGGYGITDNCYCRTIEEVKTKAEEWWVNFVSGFLNFP